MNLNKAQIITAALGIAIIFGVIFYSNKSPNSNEEIFSKVSSEISSYEFLRAKIDGSFTIKDAAMAKANDLPAGVYPKVDFSIDQVFPSNYYTSTSEDIKTTSNMKLSITNFAKDVDVISADADLFTLKRTLFYVRLNELTGVPIDLSSMKGRWWKLDLETLAKNFGGAEADELLASIKAGPTYKGHFSEINSIVKKYRNLTRIEKLSDGEIEGDPAYHFTVDLDKTELANMLVEVLAVAQETSEIEEEYEDVKNGLKIGMLEMVNIKSLEVFIQKRNYLPAQVKFSLEALDEKGVSVGEVELSVIVSGSKSVEIKAPAESTDILYLMGSLMSSLSGGSNLLKPQY